MDRALYLPEARIADEEHRELAGIPEEVAFATKPHLAGDLLERAHAVGRRAGWVAGDVVYGGRALGWGYVLAVRSDHQVTTHAGRKVKVTQAAADLIPWSAWMRLRVGHGSKGIRHYDWAMLAITSDETHDGQHDGHGAPLVRRHRYTGTLSFYRCWSPEPVPLSRLIFVACARWSRRRSPAR